MFVGRPYPCMGVIRAVRGYDGQHLWSFDVESSAFEMNCGNIDINGDGKPDCIAAGRMSMAVAFDPRNGVCDYIAL